MGKVRVDVGIIGGHYQIIVSQPFDHVGHEIFVGIHRNETLLEKILARPARQRHVGERTMQLGALVEAIEQPWQPGTVAFEKSHAQLGKFFQDTAGTKARNCLNELHRIAQGQRYDVGVGMAEKFIRHLILLGACRRMEAERDLEFFDLGPERIEIAIVNAPAVNRLRAKRQRPNTELTNDTADFGDGEIDVVERNQRRSF